MSRQSQFRVRVEFQDNNLSPHQTLVTQKFSVENNLMQYPQKNNSMQYPVRSWGVLHLIIFPENFCLKQKISGESNSTQYRLRFKLWLRKSFS